MQTFINSFVRSTLAFRRPSSLHWHAPEQSAADLLRKSGMVTSRLVKEVLPSKLQVSQNVMEQSLILFSDDTDTMVTTSAAVIVPDLGPESATRVTRCPAACFSVVTADPDTGALASKGLASFIANIGKHLGAQGVGPVDLDLSSPLDTHLLHASVFGTVVNTQSKYRLTAPVPTTAALHVFFTPQGAFVGMCDTGSGTVTFAPPGLQQYFEVPPCATDAAAPAAAHGPPAVGPMWLVSSPDVTYCALVTIPLQAQQTDDCSSDTAAAAPSVFSGKPSLCTGRVQRNKAMALHVQLFATTVLPVSSSKTAIFEARKLIEPATLRLTTLLEELLLEKFDMPKSYTNDDVVISADADTSAAVDASAGAGDGVGVGVTTGAASECTPPSRGPVVFCDASGCKHGIGCAEQRYCCLKCAGTDYCLLHRGEGLNAHAHCGQFALVCPVVSAQAHGTCAPTEHVVDVFVDIDCATKTTATPEQVAMLICKDIVPEASMRERLGRNIAEAVRRMPDNVTFFSARLGCFELHVTIK